MPRAADCEIHLRNTADDADGTGPTPFSQGSGVNPFVLAGTCLVQVP